MYYYDSSSSLIGTSSAIASNDPVSVVINNSNIRSVLVYADSSTTENIGKVTITGATGITQDVWVYIAKAASEDTQFYPNLSTAGCHNFWGMVDQRTQGATFVKIHVQGDLLDDVDVQDLVVFQVNATVQAGVKSHGTHFGTGHFRARVGRVDRNKYNTSSPHSGFQQVHNNITYIQTDNPTNPYFDCPISVPDGSLGSLLIDDYLGLNPFLSNSHYNPISVSGYIDLITAKGIRAEITAGGGIGVIDTSPSGMKGSITTPTLLNSSGAPGNIFMDSGFKPVTILSEGLDADSMIIARRWWGSDDPNNPSGTIKFRFAGSSRLAGQIIINADDQASASSEPGKWYDQIRVANPSDPNNESADYLLLGEDQGGYGTYPYTSAQLGGGAVGLVPFKLHNVDCDPVNNATTPESMLVTEFVPTTTDLFGTIAGKSIKLHFYGPVRTGAADTDPATAQPIVFEMQLTSGYEDQSHKVDITMRRGTDSGWSREIEIKGKDGADLMPGTYRITPRLTGAGRLYCDQLELSTPPSVADFSYWIELVEDCNKNGVADVDDIVAHPEWDDWGLDGGLGANGRLDQCEWTGCPADVNFDLFINGDDFDLFSAWYEIGDDQADFNYDGFVNGNDFDLFVEAFEAGDC